MSVVTESFFGENPAHESSNGFDGQMGLLYIYCIDIYIYIHIHKYIYI